jgi:hypothetical protein
MKKQKLGRKKNNNTKDKAQINRNKTTKEEKGHWASMNLQCTTTKKDNERDPKNRLISELKQSSNENL